MGMKSNLRAAAGTIGVMAEMMADNTTKALADLHEASEGMGEALATQRSPTLPAVYPRPGKVPKDWMRRRKSRRKMQGASRKANRA